MRKWTFPARLLSSLRGRLENGDTSPCPRWWLPGLAGVFLLALALRLIFLYETSASPAWGVLFIDSAQYDRWAREIAGGDWLGQGVFYLAPLYPYFLGAVYAVLGTKLLGALLVQALIGSASCVLLSGAGRIFFGAPAGIAAGLMLAVYPTAVFSDTLIQKSVLDVFLISLLLAALGRALAAPSSRRWLLAGAALGGLMLTRENASVFIPLLAASLVIRTTGMPRNSRLSQTGALFLGLALVLAPVALRNLARGGELFLTTSQFGYNLYIGNNPQSRGTYMPLIPGEQGEEQRDARELAESTLGRPLSSGEVSGYWRDRALRHMLAEPGAWTRTIARKAYLMVNALELPDAYDQYTYAEWSALLRWLSRVFHFGILLPLAGAGIVVTWARRRGIWPLHGMLLLYAGSVLLFFVLSRYRLPVVPILILFAAAFVTEAAGNLFRGARVAPSALFVAVAIAVIANWPPAEAAGKQRFKATMLNNIAGTIVYQPGRSEEAIRVLAEAIPLDPTFGPAYYNLGLACKNLGRFQESLEALHKAARILPEVPDSYFQIGEVLRLSGRPAESVSWYRRALAIDPGEPLWLIGLARSLYASGDAAGAAQATGQAAALGSRDPAVRAAVDEVRAVVRAGR